jgi:DNA-binding transcriptional regulator GbsR (MarR family)
LIPGERKEYFSAIKDIWKVATQIVKERKKRELDPMLRLLDQLEEVEGDKNDKHIKQFTDTISGIRRFGLQAEGMLDALVKADENWFLGNLMKMFR